MMNGTTCDPGWMGQMMGGAMWGLPWLGLLVGLGLVLVLATVAVAVMFGRRGSDPAKEILRQRFARGEINADEFAAAMKALA